MKTYAEYRKMMLPLAPWKGAIGRSFAPGHVYQQGAHRVDQGSCFAHAAANCIEILTGKLKVAPDILYEDSKQIAAAKGWSEATKFGASIDATCLALEKLPFVRATVTLDTEFEMLTFLANTGPFVLAVRWTEEMQFAPGAGGRRYLPAPIPSSIPMGNHAVAVVGLTGKIPVFGSRPKWQFWRTEPIVCEHHLVVENSHGMQWGNKGRALLALSDLDEVSWGAFGIILR